MISIQVGDDCFVKYQGRVFRGTVLRFWEGEQQVQVSTEAASRVYAPWRAMSFRLSDARGDAARDAELIVPGTLAEWRHYGDLADSKHVEPGWAGRVMAREKPEPVKPPAPTPAAQTFLPYADDDDDRRVMNKIEIHRPEGWDADEDSGL